MSATEGRSARGQGAADRGAAESNGRHGNRDYRRARELLWTAAHDLATPLAAIRMHINARERQKPSKIPPTANDWLALLSRIDRLAASAERMIEDVLAVERLQEKGVPAITAEILDAERVLSDTIAMNAAALERVGTSIFVERHDNLERVLGRWNQSSLERLFGNLIQNVVRHAPGAPIEIAFARRDSNLQIHFADGGPGLPVDDFGDGQAFAATQSKENSHGLGLWIIYRTVAEMGGVVVMQNRPGAGLSFDIRVPFGT